MGMSADEARQFLEELSRKSGAVVEQSDIATLQGKNEGGDLEAHKNALSKQYGERGSNFTASNGGRGGSAEPDYDGPAVMQQQSPQYAPPGGGGRGGGSVAAGQQVVQAWTGGGGVDPTLKAMLDNAQAERDAMKAQMAAQETERKTRADALFGRLNTLANQSLAIDKNDPLIRQQADAYAAQQTRASRDHLADIAEGAGPTANLLGEQRLMAERIGQATGGFEAELMGKELMAKRNEIIEALRAQGDMLSLDQQMEQQQKLAAIDAMIKEQGIVLENRGQDLNYALGQSGQALQSQLGNRGLDMDWRRAMLANDQFMKRLGYDYWDRDNYYQRN